MGTDQSARNDHRRTSARLKNDAVKCWRIRVVGRVQGVGFRPFVYRLAVELGLDGRVGNDDDGVIVELLGTSAVVGTFVDRLKSSAPPLADVQKVVVENLRDSVDSNEFASIEPGFFIRSSATVRAPTTLVPADVATCDACVREMNDPLNRRYRHALINCTDCGPRFTIVRAIPYDRSNTTMSGFPLCPDCLAEYHDPASRRFHAEPISCRVCGPRLRFRLASAVDAVAGMPAEHIDDVSIGAAVAAIRAGLIVAVKGVGGYALVVDAGNDAAVRTLRQRKHRDEKPFAIQVTSMAMARRVVLLSDVEAEALRGPHAPIVLGRRVLDATIQVSPMVAPDNDHLGVMLPAIGLHHLLAAQFDGPLVVTSGNVTNEPIITTDDRAAQRLAGIADAFLSHDRQIHRRADDSVVRRCGPSLTVLRRARGFVPDPIPLSGFAAEGAVVLGVGAELKNTVCIARGENAFVSTHLGDLEHVEAFRSFRETISDLRTFLGAEPELVVHDLHPEYLSTKWAREQEIETIGVQHHHAHIASCIAENGFEGAVLGMAFDGHGYGPDGTLWGGEFLVADLAGYRRVAHFANVALPGGASAIRDPWRMAVSYLSYAYEGNVPRDLAVVSRHDARWSDVERVSRMPITMSTSSVGRLFDAVSAILGICDHSSFEGHGAMALEQRAWAGQRRLDQRLSPSSHESVCSIQLVDDGGSISLDPSDFIRSMAESLGRGRSGEGVNHLAWLAHRIIADASVQVAQKICEQTNLGTVALSGGVFQNALLLEMIRSDLNANGLQVLAHRRVPPNDGGISLGQVAIGRAHALQVSG